MKQPLNLFEFAIIVALMLLGANMLKHPHAGDTQLAWALVLVPAAWFHLHVIWRQIGGPRRSR